MKGFWRDRKNNLHKITEMPKPYLLNAIKSLKKSMEEMIDALGSDAEDTYEFKDMAGKYLELIEEYFKRVKMYHDSEKNTPLDKVHKAEETKLTKKDLDEFEKIVETYYNG